MKIEGKMPQCIKLIGEISSIYATGLPTELPPRPTALWQLAYVVSVFPTQRLVFRLVCVYNARQLVHLDPHGRSQLELAIPKILN